MKHKLDHIGIVTKDKESFTPVFQALGKDLEDTGISHSSLCLFYNDNEGIEFELVIPDKNESLDRYISESKSSLHHIAFAVEDLSEAIEYWKDYGYTTITMDPQKGAKEGMWVQFLKPDKRSKLLIELVQYKDD